MEYREIVGDAIDTAFFVDETEPFLLHPSARAVELEPLEEHVILLARRDSLGSLEAPGLLGRLFSFLFGTRVAGRPLADPRLEALRRATITARYRHHLPDSVAAELRAEGFTPEQIRSIEMRAISG